MTRLEELERELVTLRSSRNGQTHPVVLNALIEAVRIVTKIEDMMTAPCDSDTAKMAFQSQEPPPVQRAGPDAIITGDESLSRLNDLLQQAKAPVVIEHIHGPGGVSAMPVTQGRWDAMVAMDKHHKDRIATLQSRIYIMSANLRALVQDAEENRVSDE